jgi:AcrR family transcriptional regulator
MIRSRADAAQNRIQLLQAAESVFLELGTNASLDVIAERAGVGRATLFRNFSDRQALVLALLEQGLEELEAEAERCRDDPHALVELLKFVANRIVFRAPLIESWETAGRRHPAIAASMERVMALFASPIERAVAAGICRRDLLPQDIPLLISLLTGSLYGATDEARKVLALRASSLVLELLQPRSEG